MIGAIPYLPVEELEDTPHVVVDGATRPHSVLTLSHWPQSPTPAVFARDLSAQIVFAFLHSAKGDEPYGRRHRRGEVEAALAAARMALAVTNDHFDEDGLVSVFAMVDPETALGHEELLTEVASCGDFGVVRSREAARIAFSIGPMGEEAAEAPVVVAERPGSWSGSRYRAVLERFAELVEHPERFRRHWEEPDAALSAGLEELGSGSVRIEEVPEVDLAVVTRARRGSALLSEVALNSATTASRMLTFDGGRCELYLRYEGWVRFVSRKVPLRPDLEPLAAELSAAETSSVRWRADGVGSIVTRMGPEGGETSLRPGLISDKVISYLKRAPGAWDPFRSGGALIPLDAR